MAKGRSHRLRRTDESLREVISEILLTRVRDPRIGLVSVTGVRISPEYDTARVFVTVLGDEATRAEALEGLRSAAPYIQSEIVKTVRLRRTPRLRFVYDDSIDRGFRIEETLRALPADEAKEPSDGKEPGAPPPEER